MKKNLVFFILLFSTFFAKSQCFNSITYIGTLKENPQNDGSISSSITIKIDGNIFTQPIGTNNYPLGTSYLIYNVPQGLIPLLTRVNDTTATLSFLGAAVNHTSANNTSVLLKLLPIALQNPVPIIGCQVLLATNSCATITFVN